MGQAGGRGGEGASRGRGVAGGRETRQEEPDSCWVTVFGVPPQEREAALKVLRSCGEILHHGTFGQDYSNFMHVKFSNTLEARKALSLNGKPISLHTIIGTRATSAEHLDRIERDLHGQSAHDLRGMPVKGGSGMAPSSAQLPGRSYHLEGGHAAVAQPQQGLFSKVKEYVFGF